MINNYKSFKESKEEDLYDDDDYGHATPFLENEGMEHITYLLRTTLRNKGVEDFIVEYTGYDISISVFCYELEKLSNMINIFEILEYLKTDIIPQYECEFDMFQTKKQDTILEFNFYYNE